MLRLTKNRKLKYISLHLSLNAQYWDAKKGRPRRHCPNREKIIALLSQDNTLGATALAQQRGYSDESGRTRADIDK